MPEVDENGVERTVEQVESQTERVESQLREVEQAIQELENRISSLNSKGDSEIAGALETSLSEKRQEEDQIRQESSQLASQLAEARQEVTRVDQWNNEAHQALSGLSGMGIDTSEAENRVADRERWTEQQDARISELEQRLSAIAGHG